MYTLAPRRTCSRTEYSTSSMSCAGSLLLWRSNARNRDIAATLFYWLVWALFPTRRPVCISCQYAWVSGSICMFGQSRWDKCHSRRGWRRVGWRMRSRYWSSIGGSWWRVRVRRGCMIRRRGWGDEGCPGRSTLRVCSIWIGIWTWGRRRVGTLLYGKNGARS